MKTKLVTDPAGPTPPGPKTKAPTPRQPLSAARSLSGMQLARTPEYLVIGHICADLRPDGTAMLGGTALYSALTAARLGLRVGVLTRGAFGKTVDGVAIPSLDEFAGEVSIVVQEAEAPSMFVNVYNAGRRVQTLPRWAGEIDLRGLPPHWRNARVIHLGPIAQEIDPKQTGSLTPGFLGATPQGWMREWPHPEGGRVKLKTLRLPGELLGRIDSLIVSDEEITLARDAVEAVGSRRLGVITQGENGARIVYGGETTDLPGYDVAINDLTGAGDVFAAAFFIKATERNASAISAGRFANAVAALSLRQVGPFGVPTLKEVEDFLKIAVELPIRRR
ncbi:MAG: PfkB family carbohydrate kinase [Thermomicrobiales bacterium]